MRDTQATTPAIEVEHLVKRYRGAKSNALDDISFSVRRGETFGLLGPNGAGKTTAISILTTLGRPSGGRAIIADVDVVANSIGAKQRIAVVPQRSNLDRSLRLREILIYHAAYHGVPKAVRGARADALLEEFGLKERRNDKLNWLSGGLEQRVMLARALMHDPEVLFLDEPTNNLDPQARLFLWDRIRTLHQQGITVVLTTHDMEEADQLCERIAIVDHGHLLALDTPDGLKRLIPGGTMLELQLRAPEAAVAGHGWENRTPSTAGDRFRKTLEALPGVTKVEPLDDESNDAQQPAKLGFRLYANENAGSLLASAAQAVIQEHAELLDLRFARPSLEDVFIHLTGRNLRS
jgi:ABC-2 type transport system ATP-binding protein